MRLPGWQAFSAGTRNPMGGVATPGWRQSGLAVETETDPARRYEGLKKKV